MITIGLEGCLGNQLSQIATVYALALDNNDDCAFRFYVREEAGLSGHGPAYYTKNIYSKLKALPENWMCDFFYKEPSYDYAPIPYHPNMRLQGYFGSEKYFKHRRDEIIGLFKNKDIINDIKGNFKNSLSVHVRRGDYINRPTIHPFLTMDYYKMAMVYIDCHTKVDIIYLLAEDRDMRWCKENFKDKRIVFVEGLPDYINLYMMSKCTHNIIANSSFSWWGSWLNENKDKIIVAPKKWHGEGLKDASVALRALTCDNWVLIDNAM